ncbi:MULTISPECIES: helix-turn-helix domain-containing protein [Streptococcus]|jgi:UDP-N-acetylglucosamine 1-carboxyvinyltransferase|uniref:helix-turn-helix domain-containing protein n=1 Tax=Streptococcus TaxID=1301 RepID=UPI00066B0A0A|nr:MULTISPECIES: helix-turn-helix domain-containing protein [Streptococcus]MCP9067622.1 helix-turn-helix domain-containing protein [Streptococcus parasanguinis]OFQ88683.1 UDP-N-acetylglucosamine 1-carboxyvinyltransferase [Streptococcus sp. HMSC061E03]
MIGDFLKQRRLSMGFTQEFVANQLKLSRQAISNWENGSRDINVKDLIAYAKLLEISFEDLEVSLNQPSSLTKESFSKTADDILPKHFNMKLQKKSQGKNSTTLKNHIKIEGDKVIGVHILLSSLFLNKHKLVIRNCPTAFDFLNILYELGNNHWSDSYTCEDTIEIQSTNTPKDIISLNKISRASIGIISALTYRYHRLLFTFPGGDDFCFRPIDLHLDILSTVANYTYNEENKIFYSEKNDLLNKNITLNCYADGSKSVGAFFNAISLAYVYPNEIRINGLSPDPTVCYLITLLESATNRTVEYLTSDKILIPKVDSIDIVNTEITLPPDMSMLISYVLLFWDELENIIFDNILIKDIPQSYIELFTKLGLKIIEDKHTIQFKKVFQIETEYFEFLRLGAAPFITTDLGPIVSEFLASHNISSILFDEVFIHRASHVAELEKLGIRIKVLDNGALKTLDKLSLTNYQSNTYNLKDIRAGMAILMGIVQLNIESAVLLNFDQVMRGFGNIQTILNILGYDGELYG